MTEEEKNGSVTGPNCSEPVDVEEILRKFDSEARVRKLQGFVSKILTAIAVIMSLFHLYMAGIGTMPSNKQRMIHLALTMVIIFLSYSFRKTSSQNKANPIDFLLAIASLVVNFYLFFNIDGISERAGLVSQMDIIMGFIAILLILEAARRCVGNELSILAIIFVAYAYLGPYLPGPLEHRGYSFNRLVDHMYVSAEGIYGIALGVSSTYIFLFILFGAFLGETGLSNFFTNVSMALAGDKPGGPAKVAIIASGLLGMINGSAAANVVTTGAFTIPLMKSVGYRPVFAGAVEAVASTGGQIMPPVMGAAAFIMAEFLGITYKQICIAALIPSILYYLALWVNVHLEALKTGLKGVSKDQLPNAGKEFRENGHLLLPIVLLIGLLFADYTPSYACFYSIIALIFCSFLRKHTRMNLLSLVKSLDIGARGAVGVAIACAVVGIIVGVVSLTGLGLQLANMILVMADGNLLATMVLTMIACMILGMGMPTSAAYIVAGTVAAPAMVKLGVEPIVAHMFVFYFSILSAITPPVALAAYAGAGIACADPSKVGWTAVRLGLAGFIVPFMFVYSPSLLFQSDSYMLVTLNFITATVGIICLSGALQGYMITNANMIVRSVLFISSLLLIDSGLMTDAVGFALLAVVILWQKSRAKSEAILNGE